MTAIKSINEHPGKAKSFDDCLRRCEHCRIGASNTADSHSVTYIFRDPLDNIPPESREGVSEVLAQALNVYNRPSKLTNFGFSTSEDAVTWVVFTYLLRSGRHAIRRRWATCGSQNQALRRLGPAL
jgi:hypothetical protein